MVMAEDSGDEESQDQGQQKQPLTKRQELNNHVVCMRKRVEQARVQIINRITHQIKRYKNRKGSEKDQEKARRKVNRLLEEVQVLKKIKKDKASIYALQDTKTLEEVLNQADATPEDRVLARISHHTVIKADVKKYRDDNPNWDKQIPVLLAMTREKRQKKKDKLNPESSDKPQNQEKKKTVKGDSESEEDLSHDDIDEEDSAQEEDIEASEDEGSGEGSEAGHYSDESSGVDEEVDSKSDSDDASDDKSDDDDDDEPLKEPKPKSQPTKSLGSIKLSDQLKPGTKNSPKKVQEAKLPQSQPRSKIPIINKSEGTVRVKVLSDLHELEEEDKPTKVTESKTQAPVARRPKSAFFVGGEDQEESDHEDEEFNQKALRKGGRGQLNNSQSKPIFRKGKLISTPGPPQRSRIPLKRRGPLPPVKEGNAEPLGIKRSKFVEEPRTSLLKGPAAETEKLHPSWEAKKKQQNISLTAFQGKKIVFNDDDD